MLKGSDYNNAEKERCIYFFDMDGVLAKWNTAATIEDTHQKGYFSGRELELSVCNAIKLMAGLGEKVYGLSSVYQDDHSADEKLWWLTNVAGLCDLPVIFVPYGQPKNQYVEVEQNSRLVLIDDFSHNLHQWSEAGHIGIKFYNGINGTKGTWKGYSIHFKMTPEEMVDRILCVG